MNASINLLAPLFHGPESEEIFSARRQLAEMVRFEIALAYALESAGVAPPKTGSACESAAAAFPTQDQIEAIALSAAQSGNIAIPFVKLLTSHVREHAGAAADFIHFGATSQDLLDTALVLQLRDVAIHLERQLHRLAPALIALIRADGDALLPGRTWMQQGPPIPFGLKAAQWLSATLRHLDRIRVARMRVAVLQFGGAVGTLASLGADGEAVSGDLASRLNLILPDLPWHSQRDTLVEFATTLALLSGTLGKIARDLSLMVQTEVAEIKIASPEGTGGSSTMPHKRNPVGLAVILSASLRAPGLASTMLSAMVQEHERGLGGWHAEWETLPELCRLTCGALDALLSTVDSLRIDEEAMHRNLDLLSGVTLAESVTMKLSEAIGRPAAHALLENASRQALERGTDLATVLLQTPAVVAQLSAEEIRSALNPATYLGSSAAFIDRVLVTAGTILSTDSIHAIR